MFVKRTIVNSGFNMKIIIIVLKTNKEKYKLISYILSYN